MSTVRIVLIGDSTGDGVGEVSTGDGSDLLAYGGSAIPGTITVVDEGSTLATWPDSGAGTGPEPGVMPRLAAAALAGGYTAVAIYRHAVSGASTGTVRGTFGPAVLDYLARTAGIAADSIDLVVVMSGTNDSQTGESAAYAALCPIVYRGLERLYRHAAIVWVGVGAADGAGYEEADEVRAATAAAAAARPTRRKYVDGSQHAQVSGGHFTLAGHATLADAIWTAGGLTG